MLQLAMFNKRKKPLESDWGVNELGFSIEEIGWGTKESGICVGERVVVIKEAPIDSDLYPKELVGRVGYISKIRFDLKEDYPKDPVVNVIFNGLPPEILYDEENNEKTFEFYKEELLIVR